MASYRQYLTVNHYPVLYALGAQEVLCAACGRLSQAVDVVLCEKCKELVCGNCAMAYRLTWRQSCMRLKLTREGERRLEARERGWTRVSTPIPAWDPDNWGARAPSYYEERYWVLNTRFRCLCRDCNATVSKKTDRKRALLGAEPSGQSMKTVGIRIVYPHELSKDQSGVIEQNA